MFTFFETEVSKIIEVLESTVYDNLVVYGIKPEGGTESPEIMIARVFDLFRKTYDMIKKLMSLFEGLILQLHSIINRKNPNYKSILKMIEFDQTFHLIGEILRAICTVDRIVIYNENISIHLAAFKKLLTISKGEPDKFDQTAYRLKKL